MSARRRAQPSPRNLKPGLLYLTLPSGRAITYPDAHLVPSKFEGYPPDVMFKDNAHRQWKEVRGWHGTFTENVVQGTARDILVAAIVRMEARGFPVVLHVHDDLVLEALIGAISPDEFQQLALRSHCLGRKDYRWPAKPELRIAISSNRKSRYSRS